MKSSMTRAVLSVIAFLFLTTTTIAGGSRVYYVSPGGNDTNPGTAIERPLKSINVAIRKAAAGDTIFVLPGVYREIISFRAKRGLPENPICLIGRSAEENSYPVIDGGATQPSSNATNDWMSIANSEWLEIARMKFTNGWTFPIRVTQSSYLTFRKCQFRGGKRVINASAPTTHHILVEDCSWDQGGEFLWRAEKDSTGVDAWTSMHHGTMAYFNGSLIDFSGTGGSMVIRRNTIVNAFNGVRYRGEKGCDANVEIYENHVTNVRDNDFEPEYYTFNLHIYHNISHNIHKTLSIDNVEGGQIYYYGNVVTADADPWSTTICSGIWKILGRPRFLGYPVYAFNNSFYSSGLAFTRMSGETKKLFHFNNAYLFFNTGGWQLSDWDSTNAFDYDLSNRPWSPSLTGNGQEKHGIIADAAFVDPVNGDLRLKPGSAGIDAGRIMEFPELGWTQSFSGKGPDMGAYENGTLVDGPPFRFKTLPEGKLSYKEKPRIVRCMVEGSRVALYFSAEIDPSSLEKGDVELFSGDEQLAITSVSFPQNNYQMVVEVPRTVEPGELSISFRRLPKGVNGERSTYWAAGMRVHKQGGAKSSQ